MSNMLRFYHWISNTPPLFKLTPPFESLQSLSVQLPLDTDYRGNPRLGFIYQYLSTQLLISSGRYSLELEELQINDTNGQTLGAIDLILKNHQTNMQEHWEVAIKFYLLHQGVWYGPNAHDQLDKKLDRMLSHQLKMSSSTAFLADHPEMSRLSEHLLLQGRLYVNPFSSEVTPTHCLGYEINPSQISGFWCFEKQWEKIAEPLYELDKQHWATGIEKFERPLEKPNGRFVHAQTQQKVFWFIVPDDWPKRQKP
ncbi:DUF1853 family protein [Vibrio aquimaris]|uniref:DUF1853 family protein n=1 Tax=Vibrio aquimaris TaxID=2587862 RepID=A0A5P9CL55_9VIBR|nr:DUF1853 family protein [Vibrio aquimaris]QFT26946.1 hypothetical protein FIV01_10940 [Vibrio aquimaris]